MANIESPLGTVTHSAGKRVLTVDDQSEDFETRTFSSNNSDEEFESRFSKEELEQLAADRDRLRSTRKEAQAQKNKIPEAVKKRLEILTGIGRLTEDIVVDNVTFSIRSLKPKENREIVEHAATKDLTVSQAFDIRSQTIARALYKIDGQLIGAVLNDNSIEGRVNFVEEILEESLVNHLYNRYQELLVQNKKKFSSLGDTEEEVLENVKKL